MKKFLLIILSALMILTLASCNSDQEESSTEPKDIDVLAEANAIMEKYSLNGGEYYTTGGKTLDEDLIRSYFGDATVSPDFSQVESYAVYIDETKPLKPCEFGIFKMKNDADKEQLAAFLQTRINLKLQNAIAYPTMDTEPLKTAKVTIKGNYVWYCVVSKSNQEINSNLEGKI